MEQKDAKKNTMLKECVEHPYSTLYFDQFHVLKDHYTSL